MPLKGHESAHVLKETPPEGKKEGKEPERVIERVKQDRRIQGYQLEKKEEKENEGKKPKRVMERVEEASRIHGIVRHFSHLTAYVSIRQHTSA